MFFVKGVIVLFNVLLSFCFVELILSMILWLLEGVKINFVLILFCFLLWKLVLKLFLLCFENWFDNCIFNNLGIKLFVVKKLFWLILFDLFDFWMVLFKCSLLYYFFGVLWVIIFIILLMVFELYNDDIGLWIILIWFIVEIGGVYVFLIFGLLLFGCVLCEVWCWLLIKIKVYWFVILWRLIFFLLLLFVIIILGMLVIVLVRLW